jgi:hypothetical protein
LGFNITKKEPSVTVMSVHLENHTTFHQYHRTGRANTLSSLLHYFLRPHGAFTQHGVVRLFEDLTYVEYFSLFRLAKFDACKAHLDNYYLEQNNRDGSPPMHVILRSVKARHYARMRDVPKGRGELFYLKALLVCRPAYSYLDLKTVEGTIHPSFQEAATALRIFARQSEAEYALREAIRVLKTPAELRFLFVYLLVNDCVLTPLDCWNCFQQNLCLDFCLRNPDAEDVGVTQGLQDISRLLEEHGKQPSDYDLPQPEMHVGEVQHEHQKWGPLSLQLCERAQRARDGFNSEQEQIFQQVVTAVEHEQSLLLFIDGRAGVGKSFLVNAICDTIRSWKLIVLPTATSAFAAQLYPGGRTVHSTFKVRETPFFSLSFLTTPNRSL